MRRRLAFVLLVAVLATSCRTLIVPDPPGPRSTDGFVSASWWRNQQRGYLNYARQSFSPGSYTNLINNAEWARRTHTPFNTAGITLADYANSFERMDDFVDTADFDLTYMMNLWYGYRDLLPADVRTAMEQHMRSFKYWFTDPQPAGTIDQRYYWSENHRLLFHADEYLAGQAFPNDVFGSDGNTGAWHQARARGFIDEWLTEKARFGFTEWHSDVYYQKTADALLTIIEWVDDPALVQRASSILDLLFFDIALNIQRGNFGATHGRSYMKDKSVATDQDTFNLSKLLFDDTSLSYTSATIAGATLLARAQRYRLPAVILRVARVAAYDDRPGTHGRPARSFAPRRSERDRRRRLLLQRPEERGVLVGEGRADGVADGAPDARHPRPVRTLGVGLLQAVQTDRRSHRREPGRGASARAATRPDARLRVVDGRGHLHLPESTR